MCAERFRKEERRYIGGVAGGQLPQGPLGGQCPFRDVGATNLLQVQRERPPFEVVAGHRMVNLSRPGTLGDGAVRMEIAVTGHAPWRVADRDE